MPSGWLTPRRTGATRRLTERYYDLLSEPALYMGNRPPQERGLRTILRPSVGTGPLNGRSAAAGMKTPTSLVTPLHSIDILSGGDCRSGPAGVGYPVIPSIPRALVVVRTCRSALNMLNVCVWREWVCSVVSPLTQVVVHVRRVVPMHSHSTSHRIRRCIARYMM